jgi:hypothetical protein
MDALLQNDTIIPLAGMAVGVISMLIPIAIVFVVLHFRHRRTQALYETVTQLSERGLPVPPDLLDPPAPRKSAETPLFRAITLIGVGVGLALMFYFLNLRHLAGIGALLLCIGIAQIIALRIERPRNGPL